jgi:hypothetical protein
MFTENDFLVMTLNGQAKRVNTHKSHVVKIKSFLVAKETTKMKMPVMEWRKMFANHISDKGLIF